MITELLNSLGSDIVVGIGQAAVAIALCLALVLLCRRFSVHLERKAVISMTNRPHAQNS